MPRGNRMGPMGQGPMTGRGAGFCAGYGVPGYANVAVPGYGGGFGRGFRRGYVRGPGFGGRGFGFWQRVNGAFPAEMTADDEKTLLQNRVDALSRELEIANKRLDELADK